MKFFTLLSFLKEQKIYEQYEKEFLRRVFHFTIGLIDRIFLAEDVNFDKSSLVKSIINTLDKKDYTTVDSLLKLKSIDKIHFYVISCFTLLLMVYSFCTLFSLLQDTVVWKG